MFSKSFKGITYRWPHRFGVCFIAFCTAIVGVNAQAQAALSLDRAIQLAQSSSRQLYAKDAAANSAREMAWAAGQRPDPTLKLGVNNLPVNGDDRFSLARDFMTMRSVGLMQEVTRSEKLKARSARFNRQAEVEEAIKIVTLLNLQRETATAWFDRYYQERMLEVLLKQRAEAALQVEASLAIYRGGRGTQADVFAARSMVAQIEDRIGQIEKQIGTAKIKLARWIGRQADQPLDKPPGMTSIHFDVASLGDQIAHHPEITVMSKQEDVAQAEVELASSNKATDWTVELMYSQRGPAFSNMMSVNVAVPLQWDQENRQDRELSANLAKVEQMRAEREEATREHLALIRTLYQEWQSNLTRLKRFDNTLIPLLNERIQAATAAYSGGTSPLSAVLEARRLAIDTQIDRLRLAMETAGLWVQLEYLIPVEPADHQIPTDTSSPSISTTRATEN